MEWRSPSKLIDAPPYVQIIYCCYSPFLHDVYADDGWLNEKGQITNGHGDVFTIDDERFYGWIPVPELLNERME